MSVYVVLSISSASSEMISVDNLALAAKALNVDFGVPRLNRRRQLTHRLADYADSDPSAHSHSAMQVYIDLENHVKPVLLSMAASHAIPVPNRFTGTKEALRTLIAAHISTDQCKINAGSW